MRHFFDPNPIVNASIYDVLVSVPYQYSGFQVVPKNAPPQTLRFISQSLNTVYTLLSSKRKSITMLVLLQVFG